MSTKHIKKQFEDKSGYMRLSLYTTDNLQIHKFVHQIVILTFIGNPISTKHTVDHIDKNKKNNNLKNLRWASRSEQSKNQNRNPIKVGYSKQKIIQYDLNNNFIKEFDNMLQIKQELNIDKKYISRVCLGNRKSTNGFIFKYKEITNYIDEIWKDYVFNKRDIEISSYGRIKLNNKLINYHDLSGYDRCTISKKCMMVHRLVAMCFIKNNDKLKNIVNHKDGNKKNNHVDNLEWCTSSENTRHYYKTEEKISKKVKQLDKDKNIINVFNSLSSAAKSINVRPENLSKIIKKETLFHTYYWIWND